METLDKIHVFEKAGLGIAPFRFIAIESRRGPIEISPGCFCGSPGQPMGVCDFCGESIAECCIIQDKTGKRFIVGNVCVGKTGDNGLKKVVAAEVAKRRREATEARERKQIDDARAALAVQDSPLWSKLNAIPHPFKVHADKGLTYLDYALYCLRGEGYFFRSSCAKISREVLRHV